MCLKNHSAIGRRLRTRFPMKFPRLSKQQIKKQLQRRIKWKKSKKKIGLWQLWLIIRYGQIFNLSSRCLATICQLSQSQKRRERVRETTTTKLVEHTDRHTIYYILYMDIHTYTELHSPLFLPSSLLLHLSLYAILARDLYDSVAWLPKSFKRFLFTFSLTISRLLLCVLVFGFGFSFFWYHISLLLLLLSGMFFSIFLYLLLSLLLLRLAVCVWDSEKFSSFISL